MRFAGITAESNGKGAVFAICATPEIGFAKTAIKSTELPSNSFGYSFQELEL